jgi:hypothetical protein
VSGFKGRKVRYMSTEAPTGLCLEPDESSPHTHTLFLCSTRAFVSLYHTRFYLAAFLYMHFDLPKHATCPSHSIFLMLLFRISEFLYIQIPPPRCYCLSYGAIFISILLRKTLISVFPLRRETKLHVHSIYLKNV